MDELLAQISSSNVTLAGAIFKLLLSLFLGAIVGLERRQKGQIAGMRTFSLISMGATLAMLVSIYIPQEYMGLKNGDPGRIAAQVISGIGFLGAGAIIQMKGSVRGLTTAAGIWVTACIGLSVGSGMYLVALGAALLILMVFRLLDIVEKHLLKSAELKIVRVKIGRIVTDAAPYRACFQKFRVHVCDQFLRYDYAQSVTTINFMVRSKDDTDFVALFEEIHQLGDIHSLTLTNELNN
ncbi:MAG: MgtC/SapB family protein [Bacteroidales bacterium]|nr:MgtC/SapB family protein [Candidatus Physcousia equi]